MHNAYGQRGVQSEDSSGVAMSRVATIKGSDARLRYPPVSSKKAAERRALSTSTNLKSAVRAK